MKTIKVYKVGDVVRISSHIASEDYSLQSDMKKMAGKIGVVTRVIDEDKCPADYEYYLDIFPGGFWCYNEFEPPAINKGRC